MRMFTLIKTIYIHLPCVETLRIRFPAKYPNSLSCIFQNFESYVKAEGYIIRLFSCLDKTAASSFITNGCILFCVAMLFLIL